MHAVEFQTTIHNGAIELPEEWKDKLAGAVRVIVLTEEEPAAAAPDEADWRERKTRPADQAAIERGRRALEKAALNQERIAAGWAAAMRKMGISGEPVGAEKLQEMMLAEGLDPTDNQFSRSIIEMREE